MWTISQSKHLRVLRNHFTLMLFWTPLVSIPSLQVTCHARQPWQTSIKFSEKHQVNCSEYMGHSEDGIVLLAQAVAHGHPSDTISHCGCSPDMAWEVRELIRKAALVCCHWNLLSYPQQPQRSASAEGSFVVVVSNSLLQNISWLHPRAEALSAHPPGRHTAAAEAYHSCLSTEFTN